MTRGPFTHDGRTYSFPKRGGGYVAVRDDGRTSWTTFPSYDVQAGVAVAVVVRAYENIFGSVTEAQRFVRGERTDTYHANDVWATDHAGAVACGQTM